MSKEKAFPELDPAVRRRLEERGIDIEASFREFRAEILVKVPPLLLEHLGMVPIVDEELLTDRNARIGTQLQQHKPRKRKAA